MDMTRDKLLKIIDEIPEIEIKKLLDFAECLKEKHVDNYPIAHDSIVDFWDNFVDNEVWNNV